MIEEIWNRLFGYKCSDCGLLTSDTRTVHYVTKSYGNIQLKKREYCAECKPDGELVINPPWTSKSEHYYFSKVDHKYHRKQ